MHHLVDECARQVVEQIAFGRIVLPAAPGPLAAHAPCDDQLVLGARECHIQDPPLFLDLVGAATQ